MDEKTPGRILKSETGRLIASLSRTVATPLCRRVGWITRGVRLYTERWLLWAPSRLASVSGFELPSAIERADQKRTDKERRHVGTAVSRVLAHFVDQTFGPR